MKIIFLTFFIVINYIQATSLEEIKTALAKEFRNNFPKIIISQIDLKITSLPKDFDQYEFLRIANGRFNQAQ
ncbi:flagella basal body P-ring formation protein FlgA, partial [Campylobacter jejuni]|nr:flagella basal body P-ring formation protein FlgA [Campylobacter jejuni]